MRSTLKSAGPASPFGIVRVWNAKSSPATEDNSATGTGAVSEPSALEDFKVFLVDPEPAMELVDHLLLAGLGSLAAPGTVFDDVAEPSAHRGFAGQGTLEARRKLAEVHHGHPVLGLGGVPVPVGVLLGGDFRVGRVAKPGFLAVGDAGGFVLEHVAFVVETLGGDRLVTFEREPVLTP